MTYVSPIALFVAGVIHLLPLPGIAGPAALRRLYDLDVADPNLAILLQHRALVFGLLGALMLWAIAVPPLRLAALTVGLASAAGFIVVARRVGGMNRAIARVVAADVVASVLLAAGLVAEVVGRA